MSQAIAAVGQILLSEEFKKIFEKKWIKSKSDTNFPR